MSSVKISYNHSSGYYTIYTDEGSISFGGFSELQELLSRERFAFLKSYSLNRTFLKKVACKHHRVKDKGGSIGKDGRSSKRRFDVPLKANVSTLKRNQRVSRDDTIEAEKARRLELYKEEIELCKYNMQVCVNKAKQHHDLQYFLPYKDFYLEYLYYTCGKRYLSKANESALLKRFLNLVG